MENIGDSGILGFDGSSEVLKFKVKAEDIRKEWRYKADTMQRRASTKATEAGDCDCISFGNKIVDRIEVLVRSLRFHADSLVDGPMEDGSYLMSIKDLNDVGISVPPAMSIIMGLGRRC